MRDRSKNPYLEEIRREKEKEKENDVKHDEELGVSYGPHSVDLDFNDPKRRLREKEKENGGKNNIKNIRKNPDLTTPELLSELTWSHVMFQLPSLLDTLSATNFQTLWLPEEFLKEILRNPLMLLCFDTPCDLFSNNDASSFFPFPPNLEQQVTLSNPEYNPGYNVNNPTLGMYVCMYVCMFMYRGPAVSVTTTTKPSSTPLLLLITLITLITRQLSPP